MIMYDGPDHFISGKPASKEYDDEKVLDEFHITPGLTGDAIDIAVHGLRDSFYSKRIEEFNSKLATSPVHLTSSSVIKNDNFKRWEYWEVPLHNDLPSIFIGGSLKARPVLKSFCLYTEGTVGFSKWMQELNEFSSTGMGYTGPRNSLH